jgi:creatinine amidohydrolase
MIHRSYHIVAVAHALPMSDQPTPFQLTHMTWPEVARARERVELVAIPMGSIEQHGPNTSLDTDSVICEDLTLRLAFRAHPRVLVAPTVPFGMAAYHMGFPGTITLRPQTYLHVLEDAITSLVHHGFTRFLLTNWHNGNTPVMTLAMQSLPTHLPIEFLASLSFYDLEDETLEKELIQSSTWGHADELETAELMALHPDRVKTEQLVAGEVDEEARQLRQRFWARGIRRSFDFSDFTGNGAVGNATLATASDGNRMIDVIEERADTLLSHILDAPDKLIAQGRIPAWRRNLQTP